MWKRTILCLAILSVLASAPAGDWENGYHLPVSQSSMGNKNIATRDYRPGAVLVGFHSGISNKEANDLLARKGLRAQAEIPSLRVVSLRVLPGQERTTVEKLRGNPQVAFAELDYRAQAAQIITPNDPEWDRQWSLPVINMPAAWSVFTGTQEVVIGVLDSGIDLDHPDLASQLWTNPGEIPGNQIDDDGNGKVDDLHGWHFYYTWNGGDIEPAEDSNVQDDFGHGTHVAGIAAAAANNGTGIAGIAWGARLLTVKVLDQYGLGFYSDIAAGMVYAADNGARILNLSLGGANDSQTLRTAVDYARSLGALVVAASGNTGEAVFYPAAYDPVVAVAATDASDQRPSFSNYGPQVDLAAPGTDIYSTWYRGNYFTRSGTSMATAHVSGLAALLWSRWPDLSETEMVSTLLESADDVGSAGFDAYTGWGRINAYRAVAHLEHLPDLWVEKHAPDNASPGEVITYSITYGNKGGGEATSIFITDTLPGGVVAAGAASWNIESLLPHSGPFTLTLPVTVTMQGGTLTNLVAISITGGESTPADNFTADNFSQAWTSVGLPATPGFAASKTVAATNEAITFTNTSTGTLPLSYLWNFGDTVTSTLESPSHAYTHPGRYIVTLTAANAYGANQTRLVITVGVIRYFPFIGVSPSGRLSR